jgi:hypothetical protein
VGVHEVRQGVLHQAIFYRDIKLRACDMKDNNLKLTAIVGIMVIIAAVVAFIGTGNDSDNFPKIVKAVMIGIVASLGVSVDMAGGGGE